MIIADDVVKRAQGCLLGQLSGDSLGSLVEHTRAERIKELYPNGLTEMADGGPFQTVAGQPTDDSEMALGLARSLVDRGFDLEDIARAYCDWWRSDTFGTGKTIKAAVEAGIAAVQKDPGVSYAKSMQAGSNMESEANGALMRCSPIGIFGYNKEYAVVADLARREARLTHPNPICQDASAVYCVAISKAIRESSSPWEVHGFTLGWAISERIHPVVIEILQAARAVPPTEYYNNMGWVRIALHNAFYQLTHALYTKAAIVDSIRRGGDTDTNAAICGALSGAVHGISSIPDGWIDTIRNCNLDKDRPGIVHVRPEIYWPVDALDLARRLLLL